MTAATAAKFPVIIAGAGPTGLTLSRLLSQLGIGSLLLERAPALTRHPQAHFINNRTMEVLRQMRMKDSTVASEVLKHSPPLRDWRKFIYCESLTGNILGEVDHFKGQEGPRMHHLSPEPVAHLSQHRLLPILLRAATAPDVRSEVKFGHMISGMDCLPSGRVLLRIDEAQSRSYQVECDYLIAADGANSSIRSMLGVKMMGTPAMQHLINIHFMAPGLREYLLGREAMLYFVFNSEVITVVIAHDLQRGEFVAQVPFFPPTQSLADFPEEICKRLLKSAIGVPDLDLEVLSVRRWTMHAEVAEQFKVGNVFLAGDAAHRFPPAGGFGMNTGIQDAHNLAWKLAAVIKREAGENLLESFEAERKAIATANTELSVSNWKEALKVPRALGLDPAAANVLHSAVTSRPAAMLPSGLVKSALETGLSLGRAMSGMKGPLRPWREKLLRDIFAAGDTLRLQFPKEDLGFVYAGPGAAIDSVTGASGMTKMSGFGGPSAVSGSTGAGRQQITDQSRGSPYVPSTRPGARLPHCDIAVVGASEGADLLQHRVSTLDLIPYRSTSMQLWLSGEQGAGIWAEAALQLQREGVLLKVVHICKDHEDAQALLLAEETKQMRNNVTVAVDLSHEWRHLREVSNAGAILVRPDGHVSWRALNQLQQSGHEPCLAQHASILRVILQNILRSSGSCAADFN